MCKRKLFRPECTQPLLAKTGLFCLFQPEQTGIEAEKLYRGVPLQFPSWNIMFWKFQPEQIGIDSYGLDCPNCLDFSVFFFFFPN